MLTMPEINYIKHLWNEKSFSINRMCQLFLGSVVLSLFSAFYFCTLFWLPRLRLLACLLH